MISKLSLLFMVATIQMVFTLPHRPLCIYYRLSNRVMCGSVMCNTASTFLPVIGLPTTNLPPGYYYIGNNYTHDGTPLLNLYRQRTTEGFWDHSTAIPELGCHGGFCLHSGRVNEGCTTVTDSSCFAQLLDEINHYLPIPFDAYQCIGCSQELPRYGCYSTQPIHRTAMGDLLSVNS